MKDKNYYEILEIDKNASKEIIEKAYKTLVKKYHPDVSNEISDDLIKKINEAYEVISDPQKRIQYDIIISQNIVSEEEYTKLFRENELLIQQNQQLELQLKNVSNINTNFAQKSDPIIRQKQYNPSIYKNNDFYDSVQPNNDSNYSTVKAYTNHYSMQDNSPIKNLLSLCITILLIIGITFILWHIPFTKEYLISIYESNEAIKTLVDIFI